MVYQQSKSVLFSSILGNALEFYDLGLYGFLAAFIGPSFFPATDPFVQVFGSLSVFAIGYIARPVGSIIFGHIGDKYGRKKALSNTILIMSAPTLIIGLLPTYEQIGIFAPLLLVLCRFLQGCCAGGEYNGAVIFSLEHIKKTSHGFYGGMLSASAVSGFFLASFVTHISCQLTETSWCWRIPFIVGSLISLIGFYIRHKTFESHEFLRAQEMKMIHDKPFLAVLRHQKINILRTIGIAWGVGAFSLSLIGYMNTYLIHFINVSKEFALLITTWSIFLFMLLLPLFGFLSDRIGHKKLMKIASICNIFMAMPIFWLLSTGNSLMIIVGEILFAIAVASYAAPMHAVFFSFFPVNERYSGTAFSFSIGIAFFGGTAPLIATYLIQKTHYLLSPSFYYMLSAFIGFIAIAGHFSVSKRRVESKKEG